MSDGTPLPAALFDTQIDFHGDLARNIPSIRVAQDLFDDLSDDAHDWSIAIAAEARARIPTTQAVISRPFDYGTVIAWSFDSAHWQASRFSDGAQYGVWYGSLDAQTTVHETGWHWWRFVTDSFAGEDREIVSERRVFDVRCDGLLTDLRGKAEGWPALVDPGSYTFTQAVGRYLHGQSANGLLTRSARCDGENAALLRPQRLSNVRDRMLLTYRVNPAQRTFVVEREVGQTWLCLRVESKH